MVVFEARWAQGVLALPKLPNLPEEAALERNSVSLVHVNVGHFCEYLKAGTVRYENRETRH